MNKLIFTNTVKHTYTKSPISNIHNVYKNGLKGVWGGSRHSMWPHKYYSGLTRRTAEKRRKEITHFGKYHWKDPRGYVGFTTDIGRKTRKSQYTAEWDRLFPSAKSLEEKSRATGVPLKYLKESYNRGMAAWRTGHRPGATQQQWGYARVHSLLLCGKTHYMTDADIVRDAKKHSIKARKWFERCD
jgi:hypothetical protein